LFDTLRIPLSSGRDFAAADRDASEPVAIVGASAARQFWPGKDPIGQSLFVTDSATSATKQLVVVGVARDLNVGNRGSAAPLNLYVPLQQRYVQGLTVLARTTGVRSIAGDLRRLITEMNPNLPVLTAQALESQQNGPVETQLRIAAAVAGSVGIVGLLLAAIGVYGVTAYAVARRTREIGIRLSLGARRGEVVALVLKQGMLLVAIGCVIGLLLGVGVGRLLAGQSLGVQPPDIATLAGAAAIFTVVGLVACYVPVRRASRIGAMQALRYE
jgi:putative ABC transport system permease protein